MKSLNWAVSKNILWFYFDTVHILPAFLFTYIIISSRVDVSLAFRSGCSLEPHNEHFVLVAFSVTTEKRQTIIRNYESTHWKEILWFCFAHQPFHLYLCYNETKYNLMNREPHELKKTVRRADARWWILQFPSTLFFSLGVLAQYLLTSVTENKFLTPLRPAEPMPLWKSRLGSFCLIHQLQHCRRSSFCRIFITADDVREKELSLINRLQVEFTTLAGENDLLIYKLRTFNLKVTESE